MSQQKKILSTLPLATIGISAIFGLRNLPITAQYGFSSLSIFILAALLFFIPSAYVCSYLSKKYEKSGGLYIWVKETLGEKFGFVAIWLEWINTTVSFPMMISFVIYTLLYVGSPQFAASHRVLEFLLFIVVFWALTFINFFGIKLSSRIIMSCVFLGTLFPAVLISILGFFWLLAGHHSEINFQASYLLPNFSFSSLTFLVAIINGFSGIQIIAFHRAETRSAEKTIPKAIIWAVMVILVLSITSTLAIAVVIPHHSLILIGGIVQAISALFITFHLHWLVPIMAVLIAIGVLAEVTSWVIGPSKGIAVAAETGYLPKAFTKRNARGVPTNVLIVQAIISSLLASAFTFMPTVSSAYWLLSDLTAQFALLMWLLVFGSALYLAFIKDKNSLLLKISALLGLLVSGFIAALGYLPSQKVIQDHAVLRYEAFLIGGILIFVIVPLLIRLLKKI